MKQLREFLHGQIEAFLNHEFGPGVQNMAPSGIRRLLWEPEHTARLVGHLAGNWETIEQALRVQAAYTDEAPCPSPCPYRYCYIHNPAPEGYYAGQDRLEAAADNAQADAAAAEWDATPEGEKPPVNPEVPW